MATRKWKLKCAAMGLVLTVGLGGCAMPPTGLSGGSSEEDFAVLLIEMQPSDGARGPSVEEFHRPWVSTRLWSAEEADSASWVPPTLHVRMRTQGGNGGPAVDQVLEVDGSEVTVPGVRSEEAPLALRLDRPGGSFLFTGKEVGDQNGHTVYGGQVRVRLQTGLVEAAERLNGEASSLELTQAALRGLDRSALRRYAGLRARPTLGQALRLSEAGMSASDIEQLEGVGYRFAVSELLDLVDGDVSVREAVAYRRSGFRFDVTDLRRLRSAGVVPSYAVGMKEAGYANNVDEIVALHRDEVPPEYATRMRELKPELDYRDVIELRRAEVASEMVSTLQRAEYDPTVDELVLLNARDVSASDALTLRDAGYDFTLNELVVLQWNDVPVSFTVSLMKDGFEPLTADQIVQLHERDVSPELVHVLRQQHGQGEAQQAEEPELTDELVDDLSGVLSTP